MKISLMLVALTAGAASGQVCDWNEASPAHAPQDPAYVAMAFDSARGVSVLFNTQTIGKGQETLEWNGVDWLWRNGDGPERRYGTSMVYDSARGVCVLYGGGTSHGEIDDTWEWNGQEWAQQSPGNRPDSRVFHAMAYDSKRGVTVLFGGVRSDDDNDITLGDTWEWDGQTWKQIANTGPSPRVLSAMAFDAQRGVTVLCGGAGANGQLPDTWEWDGAAWTFRTDQGPGPRAGGALVYDSALRACVLFGGSLHGQLSADLWIWDGEIWTKVDAANPPDVRSRHAMAYDSSRNAIVLFGGQGSGCFGCDNTLDDTWELACTAPCYPDLNGDGTLDLFDFLAFVNSFNAGEGNTADCDHSGSLDLFDFLCFTNAFNEGC